MDGVRANVAEFVQWWWQDRRGEQLDRSSAVAITRQAFEALTWTDETRQPIDL